MELQKVQDKRKGGKKMALITIIMFKSVRAVIIKLRLSCLLKTNDSTTCITDKIGLFLLVMAQTHKERKII
jgi:hypothetical protein